ncbi:Outer spore coat protein E (CotE) [compost metagenome]
MSGDGRVIIRVEREFAVELVAETKLNVLVAPGGDEDKDFDFGSDDGDYEDLDPDLLDDEL